MNAEVDHYHWTSAAAAAVQLLQAEEMVVVHQALTKTPEWNLAPSCVTVVADQADAADLSQKKQFLKIYLFNLFKHFCSIQYGKKLAYTQKHNTEDMLQVIKRWYSATTYITPNKRKTKKTQNRKIDYCTLLNRMF